MLRRLVMFLQFSERAWFQIAIMANLGAIAVWLLVYTSSGSGPLSASGLALSLAAIVGLMGLKAKAPVRQPIGETLPDRNSAAAWLQGRLKQRAEASRLAVLAVSVEPSDTFKDLSEVENRSNAVNDVGSRLGTLLREDDFLARGDVTDFLICLSRVRAPQADTLDQLARRLQKELRAPSTTEGRFAQPRLTIGMSSSRLIKRTTGFGLLNAAEDAHELAMSFGPGSRTISGTHTLQPTADGTLLREVVDALENGQIIAWYQPQIETETGQISGFEALARWEHPTRGIISPASFLPLIEKAGLNHKLARVILTHALSALRTWDRAGLHVPGVGVNFSAEELRNPDLADYLRWELDRFDLDPSRLVVEVLETVIAESHDDAVAKNLRAISAMGCRIDLDDFGTGFTSIINIRRFDVSRIKIDRKLVMGAGNDPSQRDLVSALLSMSEHLHVDTLGEGVETPEEQLALTQLGCGHVQGFAIARPMPLGDTLAWSADHQSRIADAKAVAVRSAEARFRPN